MRELERLEVKKSPESAVSMKKEASAKVEATDLLSTIIRLAKDLRASGRTSDADSLDEKITLYCTAEKHLYRAIDEDGEDVIDFAHKNDDGDVSPAEGDHGKVKNIVEKHKDILDVINKQPTGKYASLKKSAEWWWEDYADVVEKVKTLTVKVRQQQEKFDKTKALYENGQAQGLETGTLGEQLTYESRTLNALKNNLAAYKEDQARYENALKEQGYKKEEPAKTPEQKKPDFNWMKRNVAGKIERLTKSLEGLADYKDINEFSKIALALYTADSWEEAKQKLVAISQDNAKFNSIEDLDSLVMQWENWIKEQVKAAKQSVALKKEAIGVPGAKPAGTPAVPSKPKPESPKGMPGAVPAKQTPARTTPKRVATEQETTNVKLMQTALAALGDALKKRPDLLKNLSREEQAALYETGPGARSSVDAIDGRWGPNTRKALNVAKKLFSSIPAVKAWADKITSDGPYLGGGKFVEEDFAKQAESNYNTLNSLLKSMGAEPVGKEDISPLDTISGVKIYPEDLASAESLRDLLNKFGILGTLRDNPNELKNYLENLRSFLMLRAQTADDVKGEDRYKKYVSNLFSNFDALLKNFQEAFASGKPKGMPGVAPSTDGKGGEAGQTGQAGGQGFDAELPGEERNPIGPIVYARDIINNMPADLRGHMRNAFALNSVQNAGSNLANVLLLTVPPVNTQGVGPGKARQMQENNKLQFLTKAIDGLMYAINQTAEDWESRHPNSPLSQVDRQWTDRWLAALNSAKAMAERTLTNLRLRQQYLPS